MRDLRLNKQFIIGINDEEMMIKTIKELTTIKSLMKNNWSGVNLGKKSR